MDRYFLCFIHLLTEIKETVARLLLYFLENFSKGRLLLVEGDYSLKSEDISL
jgi:hypothetical protein